MTDAVVEIAGRRAWLCAEGGPLLASERDAAPILEGCLSEGAWLVVVPTARLSPEFLDLSTRIAGEVLQKLVTYRRQVAIVGDIVQPLAASGALRDFVRESNRGRTVWFVPDLAALEAKLSQVEA